MRVLTMRQMREVDHAAFTDPGEVELMRRAGARVAETALKYAPSGRIVALAGKGNNGGDAFAALAALPADCERVVYTEATDAPSEARRDAESRARAAGVEVRAFPGTIEEANTALSGCAIVFDALVGTGSRLSLPQHYETVVEAINAARAFVLAIDIPSGVDADTGAVAECAVQADATVTLGALKIGLLLQPARAHCGDLWIGDIGLSDAALATQRVEIEALNDAEFLALLPRRKAGADKRSAGAPLIIAGSTQFPGAAVLCALGAARAGAGYVTVATMQGGAPAIRAHLIEQVVVTIDDTSAAEQAIDDLLDVAKRCSSVALGPGLGLDDRMGQIVLGFVERCSLPMVADASALFHFAKHLELLRDKCIVLTPHEGEFARLSGKGTVKSGERMTRLREFVDRTRVTTLLKGETTLVYDGGILHLNTTGTPALATAGTGDVLTGIIATLLAQGLSPVDAARAGAYWHGLAAKCASRDRRAGVIARDVADALGHALPLPHPAAKLLRVF